MKGLTLHARLALGASAMALATSFGMPDAYAQTVNLEPISIFATAGGSIEAFAYPGQVAVVDREQMDDFVATRPADVFKGVSGVYFNAGPRRSGQVPNIRGFEGEGVVVLFDDARQNFVSGHDGRFFIDTDILTAAEVVKGPTSSVYGSGAIGGVMAFRTISAADLLEPGQDAAVRVKTSYASVDKEKSVSVTGVQRSETGSVDLVAHMGYRGSGDIALGSGDTLPADDKLRNALLKGAFDLGGGFKWTTSYTYYDLNALDPQNPSGNNVGEDSNPLVDRKVFNGTLQSKLEIKPGNDLIDAKIVAYRTQNEVEEPEVESGRVTTREVETLGFKADNTSRFRLAPSASFKLTYGTDIYRDDQVGSDDTSTDGSRGGVPDATSTFAGFFAEGELELGRPGEGLGQLKLIPGIRYDKFTSESDLSDDIDETAVSPKIAASYSPLEWFSLFGNYGKAFRAPSYNEAYSVGNHFVIPLPGGLVANDFITNPDLQPETALGWEAGASLKFNNVLMADDRLRVKGSYWENKVDNLIQLVVNAPFENLSPVCFGAPPLPFFPPCVGGAAAGWTSQHVNVANAELEGFELEASYDSRYFFLRTTYAQIEGRDADTGEYLESLYPNKFFVDAAVKFPSVWTRVGARATIAGEYDMVNDPGATRDAYKVYDLYAVWKPEEGSMKGLRVDLGIDNVTDEDYEIVTAGVSEEGRSYKAAVSYTIPFCGTAVCR